MSKPYILTKSYSTVNLAVGYLLYGFDLYMLGEDKTYMKTPNFNGPCEIDWVSDNCNWEGFRTNYQKFYPNKNKSYLHCIDYNYTLIQHIKQYLYK